MTTRTQKLTEHLVDTATPEAAAAGTVARRLDPARDLLMSMESEFEKCLPKTLPPDLFMRVALTGFRKTPDLLNCSRRSLLGALLETARLGLEPCTEQAYLIPYKTECTLVIGYQGYVQLMYRTGLVSQVEAEMIYEADEWDDSRGDGGRFFHRPNWMADDRGRPILAYAFASLAGGGRTKVEVCTRGRAEQIKREYAKSQKSPWNSPNTFNAMWQKSPIRQLQKWAPKSAELRRALIVDGASYDTAGQPDVETDDPNVVVAEVVEPTPPAATTEAQGGNDWSDVEVARPADAP